MRTFQKKSFSWDILFLSLVFSFQGVRALTNYFALRKELDLLNDYLLSTLKPTDEINMKSDQFTVDKLKDFKLSKAKREKYYGDLRYARPGEYVILIDDITEPPFLGFRLPTAFCLAKVAFPKKSKKVAKSKKDSKSSTKLAAGGD